MTNQDINFNMTQSFNRQVRGIVNEALRITDASELNCAIYALTAVIAKPRSVVDGTARNKIRFDVDAAHNLLVAFEDMFLEAVIDYQIHNPDSGAKPIVRTDSHTITPDAEGRLHIRCVIYLSSEDANYQVLQDAPVDIIKEL